MDSPIFGSKKSSQNSKNKRYPEYSTTNSDINPAQWYVTNKNNSASQISHDLKLAYTLLVLQKNLKIVFAKINKCMNKKKNEAFEKILALSVKSSQAIQKGTNQIYKSNFQSAINPQMKSLAIVCSVKVNHNFQNLCRVLNCLKLKKIAKAWSRLYIMCQKQFFPPALNEYASCVVSLNQLKQSDLDICSKIEGRKNPNSKKHAKQMKENSIFNQTGSEIEHGKEKIINEIIKEEKMFDKFTEQMNAILDFHNSILAVDSDRQTWLSDNGISHSSLQNNTKGGKNQRNKKR